MDIERIKANIMVAPNHLDYLSTVVDACNRNNTPGAFVECGVWKGGVVMFMVECQKRYSMDRDIYLYDTFSGMTEPASNKDGTEEKNRYRAYETGAFVYDADKWHGEQKWCYAPLEFVKNNVSSTRYDETKIHYVVGDVCETLQQPVNIPDQIAILRLDTDWYESTKMELDVLFPKVVLGGTVIVDDYFNWPGSNAATNEFLAIHRDKVRPADLAHTGQILAFTKVRG